MFYSHFIPLIYLGAFFPFVIITIVSNIWVVYWHQVPTLTSLLLWTNSRVNFLIGFSLLGDLKSFTILSYLRCELVITTTFFSLCALISLCILSLLLVFSFFQSSTILFSSLYSFLLYFFLSWSLMLISTILQTNENSFRHFFYIYLSFSCLCFS